TPATCAVAGWTSTPIAAPRPFGRETCGWRVSKSDPHADQALHDVAQGAGQRGVADLATLHRQVDAVHQGLVGRRRAFQGQLGFQLGNQRLNGLTLVGIKRWLLFQWCALLIERMARVLRGHGGHSLGPSPGRAGGRLSVKIRQWPVIRLRQRAAGHFRVFHPWPAARPAQVDGVKRVRNACGSGTERFWAWSIHTSLQNPSPCSTSGSASVYRRCSSTRLLRPTAPAYSSTITVAG